ncbi:MAG: hypothetical protein V4697_02180 [Patescibacteria group bacterium]
MASWASRRKALYGSIVLLVLIVGVGVPAFFYFYKAPTCNDRMQNGNELGIDCGGSCVLLCQSSFLPPRIEWGGAKFEKVADGLYNAAAYIINPNLNGAALDVPYKMAFFDEAGILITEKKGVVTLPAHRNALAFEPAIDMGQRIPSKATFEFLAPPLWFKSHDALEGLAVTDKKYQEDANGSSLEVTLENKTLFPYRNMTVSVILSDIEGNAIGFSRTTIDEIAPKNGQEVAPYTWPFARDGRVKTIEVVPVVEPTLDR